MLCLVYRNMYSFRTWEHRTVYFSISFTLSISMSVYMEVLSLYGIVLQLHIYVMQNCRLVSSKFQTNKTKFLFQNSATRWLPAVQHVQLGITAECRSPNILESPGKSLHRMFLQKLGLSSLCTS